PPFPVPPRKRTGQSAASVVPLSARHLPAASLATLLWVAPAAGGQRRVSRVDGAFGAAMMDVCPWACRDEIGRGHERKGLGHGLAKGLGASSMPCTGNEEEATCSIRTATAPGRWPRITPPTSSAAPTQRS